MTDDKTNTHRGIIRWTIEIKYGRIEHGNLIIPWMVYIHSNFDRGAGTTFSKRCILLILRILKLALDLGMKISVKDARTNEPCDLPQDPEKYNGYMEVIVQIDSNGEDRESTLVELLYFIVNNSIFDRGSFIRMIKNAKTIDEIYDKFKAYKVLHGMK